MASEESEKPSCSKTVAASGKYCCVPECKNSSRKDGKQTGKSFFQIPSKGPDRTKWIKVLTKYRRKGFGDSFDPKNKKYFVCEDHFPEEDLINTFGSSCRKRVRKDKVQSLLLNKFLQKRKGNHPENVFNR